MYVVVIVMADQFLFELFKELVFGQMPKRLEPCFDSLQCTCLFLGCGATLDTCDAFTVLEPIKFKSQKREGSVTFAAGMESAKADYLRLTRFHLQVKTPQSFRQDVVESSCIIPVLKGTHPIISIAAHDCTTFQV